MLLQGIKKREKRVLRAFDSLFERSSGGAAKRMDPGRYGFQQGWDNNNNSVIAVSYLNNHLYRMMMMMIMTMTRDKIRTRQIVQYISWHLIVRKNEEKLWDSEDYGLDLPNPRMND